MLSNAKVLKLFKKVDPEIKWVRQKAHDTEADGPAFAGTLGKVGIRFQLVKNYTPDILHLTARTVAARLRRGDTDAKAN